MAENRTVRRSTGKKKKGPKIKFNIWLMIILFAVTFAGCFVLYMIAANVDDDFFSDGFSKVVTEQADPEGETQETTEEGTAPAETTYTITLPKADNPVQESAAMDISYLENCCLVTDSTLLGMKDAGFSDVFGNEQLSAATASDTKVDSNFGTVTVGEALKLKKPMNVYIMLGSDIGTSVTDDLVSSYMNLVSGIKTSLPEMKIYVMQLPPVFGDSAKNALINDYNTRVLALADTLGVYCIDTNTAFKSNDGNLSEEYADTETGGYNSKFYDDIKGIILTHTVS